MCMMQANPRQESPPFITSIRRRASRPPCSSGEAGTIVLVNRNDKRSMISMAGPPALHDISRLVSIAPRVTKVTQRLPSAFQQHLRHHAPSRLNTPQQCSSQSTGKTGGDGLYDLPGSLPVHSTGTLRIKSKRDIARDFEGERLDHISHVNRSSDVPRIYEFRPGFQKEHRDIWNRAYAQARTKRRYYSTHREKNIEEKRTDSLGEVDSHGKDLSPPSQSDHGSFYGRLHLPHFHRPTKEELLGAATGFWSRLRIRFKWSTIRSVRPFNVDEITGFMTWILMGHILWLVIGTTTFVSLAILAINTVFAQETLAGWVGSYLTKSSGLKVVFESAVVPRWGNGVIQFKNVFVSRRPGKQTKSGVTKGSAEAAAIAAAGEEEPPPEDQNYTQFDITLGEVNVTLSFRKWWNGKGLLQNVEVKHVRGVVDRTHVFSTGEYVDPKTYRHEHQPGDFEIESFKVEDLLVNCHQPHSTRPFMVSIYNGDLPRLRKQWLFYDLLSANSMTGEFDRSLFTIHPRQTHTYTGAQLNTEEDSDSEPWLKHSRIRVDALNIEHLNRGVEGPFSWIQEGNVDIVADVMIPKDNDESVIKVMSDFYDRMEATLIAGKHPESTSSNANSAQISLASASEELPVPDPDKRFIVLDLRVHLNDVRASVPLFTRDLSYVSNALIRPIVAYINSRRTFIPINCRVVKRALDFDGSWTVFDSGLMDDLSAEVYEAFAKDVTDEQARMRRFKTVGLWSIQVAVQAIFMGNVNHVLWPFNAN